jgi:hypothetical protein
VIAVRARAEGSGQQAVKDEDCGWKLPSAYCLLPVVLRDVVGFGE